MHSAPAVAAAAGVPSVAALLAPSGIIHLNNNSKSDTNNTAEKRSVDIDATTASSSSSSNNNAEHNHHHTECRISNSSDRPAVAIAAAARSSSQEESAAAAAAAANSKSTSKPLSDNKDSFSSVSPRVLSLRVSENMKQQHKHKQQQQQRRATMMPLLMDKQMKNNKSSAVEAALHTPSLVRIPKSDGQRALNLKAKLSHVSRYFKPNNYKSVISLSSSTKRRVAEAAGGRGKKSSTRMARGARTASSSITLIVSKRREPRTPRPLAAVIVAEERIIMMVMKQMMIENGLELPRRLISALCVPLMIGSTPLRRIIDGISCTEATICTVGALSFQDNNKSNEPLNISFKNCALEIELQKEMGKMMRSKEEGVRMIIITEERESNLTLKSLSKSTPSVKSSDKSDTDVVLTMINDDYDDDNVDDDGEGEKKMRDDDEDKDDDKEAATGWVAHDIPTLTTCDDEPTMTLRCQSTTAVTSQTNDVPADEDDDDDLEVEVSIHLYYYCQ